MADEKTFKCSKCGHIFKVPYGIPKPDKCPNCGVESIYVHRIDGGGRGMGPGRGRRCGGRMF